MPYDKLDSLLVKRSDLEHQLQDEINVIDKSLSAGKMELESVTLRPRKADISVEQVALVWIPVVQPAG